MKRIPLGPLLVALGVFGGGLLWIFLTGLRFDYIITVIYGGAGPGESIWALDPLFTILAATPGLFLALAGFIFSVTSNLEEGALSVNLFYIGEICLLVSTITSVIGFLGSSSLIVEAVIPYTVISGIIVFTGSIHLLSPALSKSAKRVDSFDLSINTAAFLLVEFVILLAVVVALHLYTWSSIRLTTFVITSSGILGLLLLIPRYLNLKL